ncbi:hypothetical protein QQ045_012237 [Rhodiola kirilowii]
MWSSEPAVVAGYSASPVAAVAGEAELGRPDLFFGGEMASVRASGGGFDAEGWWGGEGRGANGGSAVEASDVGFAVERAGPSLDEIRHRLPHLEAAVRPIRANKDALMEVGEHINRAVTPAASVLKWLEDIVEYLGDNSVADEGYILSNLKSSLKTLSRLQKDGDRSQLDDGLFNAALDKLETEFR